jgi:hypothetical protein
MALSCAGADYLKRIPFDFRELLTSPGTPPALRLQFMLAPHPGRESRKPLPERIGSGVEIDAENNRVRVLNKHQCGRLQAGLPIRKPALGTGNTSYFMLGYGNRIVHHYQTDDFEFRNPDFRVTRFYSLFDPRAPVTDPVAFLNRLSYRALSVSRFPAKWTLERVCSLIEKYLEVNTSAWLIKENDFGATWSGLRPWQRRTLLPVLDAVRNILDASPFAGKPLEIPGLMLLDRPERLCPERMFRAFIRLLDELFPGMQFVITLSRSAQQAFPIKPGKRCLKLPKPTPATPSKKVPSFPRGTILLLQLDGRLPNLALMKLSRHFKDQGKNVTLVRGDALIEGVESVHASSIFFNPKSHERMEKLLNFYGDSLRMGGSGVDVTLRLPIEIEALPADYSLYPELGDRAIGFLTRGCKFACPFCIVPQKEGAVRQVSDLDALLDSGRRGELILLDDNILSHGKAGMLLEQMANRNLKVNFNQTLDLRLVDRQTARLLNRIDCSNVAFTRRVIHFSLNDTSDLDRIRRCYSYFGFTPADNVEFICMYGFNTTLAEDLERFRFLRSLPGAYVFVQEYHPIPGGPPPKRIDFFDESPDRLINELVEIIYSQNMKSMEKYYRWLSKKYAQTFGRLHPKLVDTIFRYNRRDRKGRYLQSLAGTVPRELRDNERQL